MPERRRFHVMFETMHLGAMFVDARGRIIATNPAALTALDIPPDRIPDTVTRDKWEVRTPEGSLVSSTEYPSQIALRTGTRVPPTTYQWRNVESGTKRWFNVSAIPMQTDGVVDEVLVLFEDVTERRKLEEQFVQAQKLEAIGTLAGGIAHDFNNILTLIIGYTELLQDHVVDDDGRSGLEEVRKASWSGAALTNQLLSFSRKQILRLTVLDLSELMASLEPILRRIVGEDVSISFVRGARESLVRADRSQMEQIVMNLVGNARDAMPKGGKLTIEIAHVRVSESYAAAQGAAPGDYVMLAVTDSGVGMNDETKGRIFEPFFTTKGPGKGTGLGLATVYGVTRQTGGFVTVYSEPGIGSTFKVYLPHVHEPAIAAPPAHEPAVPERLQGTETILVVEDEDAVRHLVRNILVAKGYTVLDAANSREAMLLASRYTGPIHLLLTDVVMPEQSGKAVADAFQEIRPDTPVLFMSGYTENAIVHHGVLEARTNFLHKPFTGHDLLVAIRAALQIREL